MRYSVLIVILVILSQNSVFSQERVVIVVNGDNREHFETTDVLCRIVIDKFEKGWIDISTSPLLIGGDIEYEITKDSIIGFKEISNGGRKILERRAWDGDKAVALINQEHADVNFHDTKCNDLSFDVNASPKLSTCAFHKCEIGHLLISDVSEVDFWNNRIDSVGLQGYDTIRILTSTEQQFKKFEVEDYTISEFSNVKSDSLLFYHCTFSNEINFSQNNIKGKRVIIGFKNMLLDKISFDCQFFKLDTTLNSYQETITQFNSIKDMQKANHFEKGYERADKDLIKFQYLNDPEFNSRLGRIIGKGRNWIAHTWWDYSYNRGEVIGNSLYIMFVFFFVNLFFFKKLLSTYPIKSLVEAENKNPKYKGNLSYIKSFFYCFFYTGTLFWGIKFDFEKVSLQRIGLVILVIVEYTTGIVCLAYIANYIIVR